MTAVCPETAGGKGVFEGRASHIQQGLAAQLHAGVESTWPLQQQEKYKSFFANIIFLPYLVH